MCNSMVKVSPKGPTEPPLLIRCVLLIFVKLLLALGVQKESAKINIKPEYSSYKLKCTL